MVIRPMRAASSRQKKQIDRAASGQCREQRWRGRGAILRFDLRWQPQPWARISSHPHLLPLTTASGGCSGEAAHRAPREAVIHHPLLERVRRDVQRRQQRRLLTSRDLRHKRRRGTAHRREDRGGGRRAETVEILAAAREVLRREAGRRCERALCARRLQRRLPGSIRGVDAVALEHTERLLCTARGATGPRVRRRRPANAVRQLFHLHLKYLKYHL